MVSSSLYVAFGSRISLIDRLRWTVHQLLATFLCQLVFPTLQPPPYLVYDIVKHLPFVSSNSCRQPQVLAWLLHYSNQSKLPKQSLYSIVTFLLKRSSDLLQFTYWPDVLSYFCKYSSTQIHSCGFAWKNNKEQSAKNRFVISGACLEI